MAEGRRYKSFLLILFFFSGFTSLVYEISWSRILATIVGNTSLAISLIVGIFMTGLAIGSLIAARLRVSGKPVLAYGCLEGFIGLYSLLTPSISVWIDRIYANAYAVTADDFLRSVLLKAALATILLLLPTLAMGATLPVLLRAFREEDRGENAGLLYGMNTAGAVAGTLLAGYFLLPQLGISGTIHLNAALNGVLLSASIMLSRQPKAVVNLSTTRIRPFQPLYLLPFFTGFAALCYEILWTRALSMYFGSSVYAFSAILAAFLLGIAAGSAYYARRISATANPYQFFSLIQFRLALSAVFFIGIFMGIPAILILLFRVFHGSFALYQSGQFLLIGAAVFYTTFLSGASFPASLHFFRSSTEGMESHAGYVYGYNTIGSILGSFCAGFLMIPLFGVERSIRIVILVNLILGIYCFRKSGTANRRILAIGGAAVLLLLVLPRWNQSIYNAGFYAFAYKYVPSAERESNSSRWTPDMWLEQEAEAQPAAKPDSRRPGELNLLYYSEGWTANVAVSEDDAGVRSLLINGKPDASNVPAGDMRTQLLLGHLPMLFAEHPRDALVIGLGSGVTAGALSAHALRRIDAVEIEEKVVEASDYFRDENRGILKNPKFHLTIDDARNVVQHRDRQYDVITSEPSNLWMSGVANLFTREFFQSTHKRLAPGGVLCQWLHLYQISAHDVLIFLKTIHSVYPHFAVWIDDSDMLVIASDRPVVPDRARIEQILTQPQVVKSLVGSNITASTIFEDYVSDERIVKLLRSNLPINTDDHPVLEFSAPRSLFLNQAKTIQRTLYEMWRLANES